MSLNFIIDSLSLIFNRYWFKYSLRQEISELQVIHNSLSSAMVAMKKFKAFDDALLAQYPDLKEVLKPNDQYPELQHILKLKPIKIPDGSINTKIIINDGEVIERVYKTPKGQIISLFSNSYNIFCDQAA